MLLFTLNLETAGETPAPAPAPAPAPVAEAPIGGGYLVRVRKKTPKEIREERERLGILPEVEEVIEQQAAQNVIEDVEPAQKKQELKKALANNEIRFRAIYLDLLREHEARLRQRQEQDDEEFLALL